MTAPGAPILVGDLRLDAPLPELNTDGHYQAARLLGWLHGRPLGEVALRLDGAPLRSGDVAARAWPQVARAVRDHCQADGIGVPTGLTEAGLSRPGWPRCASAPVVRGGPAITVVVATRDRTESLLRCLASLARTDYRVFDVLVVDSAPRTLATERALAGTASWPFQLQYLRVPRPGLAHAHNEALRAVTGDIVAFTDDDVEVGRSWLSALARAFAEPGVTCVTGLILPAELETPAQVLVEEHGGYSRGLARRTFTRGMPETGPLFPFTAGRFGSGANMAFRRSWLVDHGGFDPATGAGSPARGGDDLAVFLRVITEGGTLVYDPAAVVRHWHQREYDVLRNLAFGYGVGLGAYLASSLCARPTLAGPMIRRAFPAVRHLLGPSSAKNAGRGTGFPRELVWRERAGVVAGPLAYAVSRWRYRDCEPVRAAVPRMVPRVSA